MVMLDKHIRATQNHYEKQRDNVATLIHQLMVTVRFNKDVEKAYSDAYLGLYRIESIYEAKIDAIIDGEWIPEGNW